MALIELMMSEYHYSLHKALSGISVAAIFALLPAKRSRQGDDSGPSHAEQASIQARARARAYLEANYTLID